MGFHDLGVDENVNDNNTMVKQVPANFVDKRLENG